MERRQRITMLLVAVVIAIGAFVLLGGGGGGGDDEDAQPAQNTTPDQTRPGGPDETNAAPKPRPEAAQIVIANGELRGGAKRIEAKRGDTIRIDVRADVADELHLHGYDVIKDVRPGSPARFRVKADIEGVFELEGHDSFHGTIANVVVEP